MNISRGLSRQRYGLSGRISRMASPSGGVDLSESRPITTTPTATSEPVTAQATPPLQGFGVSGPRDSNFFNKKPESYSDDFLGPGEKSAISPGQFTSAALSIMSGNPMSFVVNEGARYLVNKGKPYVKYVMDRAMGSIKALHPSEQADPAGLNIRSDFLGSGSGGSGSQAAGTNYGSIQSDFEGINEDIESDSGGEGNSGGGTVLCTEIHRQGLMSDADYSGDSQYGSHFDLDTVAGYRFIATPIAKKMRTSPLLTAIIKPFVLAWTQHSLFKIGACPYESRLGVALETLLAPVCNVIGRTIKEFRYGRNSAGAQ